MPYFKKLELLFLHIPKTGGTSCSKWLIDHGYNNIEFYTEWKTFVWERRKNPQFVTQQHMTFSELQPSFPIRYILIIVRHPVTRLFSEYMYIKYHLKAAYQLEKIWTPLLDSINLSTFDGFIHSILSDMNRWTRLNIALDNHLRLQSDYLVHERMNIFRFEEMFPRLSFFLQSITHINTLDPLPHELENPKKEKFQCHPLTWERIVHVYLQDFIQFGYSIDYCPTLL